MSSPKVDHAIALVKELVQTGQLRPGDRLPREDELSARLSVSRNSLREAVRALQTVGILEARQGDGTYVSGLDPAAMIGVLQFAVDVSYRDSIVWFLEFRRDLEVISAQTAAARRTDVQLDGLRALHDRLMSENDPAVLMDLDRQFHDRIAEIGCNPVHAAILSTVSAPTVRARLARQSLNDTDFMLVRGEHARILDAIENRDVDGVRYAMWSHVSRVIDWVRANPDAIGSDPGLRTDDAAKDRTAATVWPESRPRR